MQPGRRDGPGGLLDLPAWTWTNQAANVNIYRAARPFRFRVLVYLHRTAGRKVQGRGKMAVLVRLSALMIFYFYPLYILAIKILSFIHVSFILIILYISYSILTTNHGPTCHPL
jgi:hypothetical protein